VYAKTKHSSQRPLTKFSYTVSYYVKPVQLVSLQHLWPSLLAESTSFNTENPFLIKYEQVDKGDVYKWGLPLV
jgi:hypothetical protein